MALQAAIRRLTLYSTLASKVKFTPSAPCSVTINHVRGLRRDSFPSHPAPLLVQCIYRNCLEFGEKIAITDSKGDHSYKDIYNKSMCLSEELSAYIGPPPISMEQQKQVCLMLPHGADYVVAQWAVWMAGHVVVPLCPDHPSSLLKYFLRDSRASAVICAAEYEEKLPKLSGIQTILFNDNTRVVTSVDSEILGLLPADSKAMILYTSGTTGDPKGVVVSHGGVQAQVQGLSEEWQYSGADVLLHCLPLHHTHGIVNALVTPLSKGARVVMTSFSAERVWKLLLGNEEGDILPGSSFSINLFMAVPTIYAKLLHFYEEKMAHSGHMRSFVRATCEQNLRLMVSGSAALPVSVLTKWRVVTGHTLLERYGMTEIGMALTNPLNGERREGYVGRPFPGVSVRLATNLETEDYKVICEGNKQAVTVTHGCEQQEGELLVKGPSVFKEYFKRPKATRKEFTADNWFKTGDTAVYTDGNFKILGRTSVDIIKTGGFKVSALQVERALLEHPQVGDVAVVGVKDITWGQQIAAVIVWKSESEFNSNAVSKWLEDLLPRYQIPSRYITVEEIPRNNMGKVNKKQLLLDLFPNS